ncbi:MAG: hypothetical protein ACM3ST_10280 [Bdellovibrio bacteriovorus]
MTYSDLPRLLTMVLVWAALLAWHSLADRSGCLVAAGLVTLFTLILTLSSSELALARRQAFIDACLEPGGSLRRLLGRRYLLIGVEAAKSLVLAAFLVVSALTLVPRQWSLMFAVVLLMGLLLPRFYAAFAGQLRDRYRYATARRWTLWCGALLLWLEALISLFYSSGEGYMGLRWQEAIVHGARQPEVGCAAVAQLGAVLSAVESLGLWSVQNLQRNLADLPQSMAAGFGLLASMALAFLQAYVFSLALIGVVARPWSLWRPEVEASDT